MVRSLSPPSEVGTRGRRGRGRISLPDVSHVGGSEEAVLTWSFICSKANDCTKKGRDLRQILGVGACTLD